MSSTIAKSLLCSGSTISFPQVKKIRIVYSWSSFPIWKRTIMVITFFSRGHCKDVTINACRCSECGRMPSTNSHCTRSNTSVQSRGFGTFRPQQRSTLAGTHHSTFTEQKRHLPAINLTQHLKQIWNLFSLETIILLIQMHLTFGHTRQTWRNSN